MREASWLELPARYSMSMPENFLNASGSLVLAPGSGGPLTTTLPSALPAARSVSHVRVVAAPDLFDGAGGAEDVVHAAAAPARPAPRVIRNCRRLNMAPPLIASACHGTHGTQGRRTVRVTKR